MIHAKSRRWYTGTALALVLLLLTVWLALGQFGGVGASGPTSVAPAAGVVTVYPGLERPGLERVSCGFIDGYLYMHGEVSQGRLYVSDPLNTLYYRSEPIAFPPGYVVRSLDCTRSSQTGLLVVAVGGLIAGGNTQLPLTLSTDYPIRAPIPYEDYALGQR